MGSRPAVARGFTLLELIVTLSVLALAVALVTPAIGRGTDALKARAEVAGFAAVLRHARELAISTQRPHRVVIDPEAHRMAIVAPPPASVEPERVAPGARRPSTDRSPSTDKSPSTDAASTETQVRETRALSPRLTVEAIKGPELDVTFDARGFASGGDFRITSGGLVYRVTVDRLTGRVKSVRE
jgi:prepilin-type N-terminal cleavage/methylation domain-containing protein